MAGEKTTQAEREQLVRLRAQEALKQVPLSAGQTVIVAYGPQVLVCKGDLKSTESQDVANHVADGWQERGQSARIQFMRLPMLTEDRLLYSQPLGSGYFLTVVDSSDSNLPRVTQLIRQLRPLLEGAGL